MKEEKCSCKRQSEKEIENELTKNITGAAPNKNRTQKHETPAREREKEGKRERARKRDIKRDRERQ